VSSPSRLVYNVAGKGFTHFRGIVGIENPDVGSTLQPQIRFFIFDQAPNMDRLVAPTEMSPAASTPATTNARDVVDRIFLYALARPPSVDERTIAEGALADPARPGRLAPSAVADLLWAVLMKPEFQLIY